MGNLLSSTLNSYSRGCDYDTALSLELGHNLGLHHTPAYYPVDEETTFLPPALVATSHPETFAVGKSSFVTGHIKVGLSGRLL